ncbi:MAG: YqgE/AlgH family protein [Pseudomonadales bacterium]|nr:YqgE/AlgH family protein [Pseudomonadales bacterium]
MNDHRQSFRNQFLVALPSLEEDYFSNTISLLVDHNAEGAFGLMINHPLDIEPGELIPALDGRFTCQVFEGGPVEQNRLFFLHSCDQSYDDTLPVSEDICMTASSALIDDLARGKSPERIIALLGYAGWGAEQLEDEIARDIWLLTPADASIVFDAPIESRASRAAQLLGVDLNLMGIRSGHD